MSTQRVKTEHKVFVDTKKAHWDYDCDCYSFQSPCDYCAIERCMNKKGLKGKIDRLSYGLEEKIYVDLEGKTYTANEEVVEWMGTFDSARGPFEAVLLFKEDLTIDIRVTDNLIVTIWG